MFSLVSFNPFIHNFPKLARQKIGLLEQNSKIKRMRATECRLLGNTLNSTDFVTDIDKICYFLQHIYMKWKNSQFYKTFNKTIHVYKQNHLIKSTIGHCTKNEVFNYGFLQ